MKIKHDAKNIIGKILQNKTAVFVDKNIMHPERDWFLGLLTGIFVIVLGVSFGVNRYLKYSQVNITDGESVFVPVTFKQNLAAEVLANYQTKQTVYEETIKKITSQQQLILTPAVSTPDVSETPEGQQVPMVDNLPTAELESDGGDNDDDGTEPLPSLGF